MVNQIKDKFKSSAKANTEILQECLKDRVDEAGVSEEERVLVGKIFRGFGVYQRMLKDRPVGSMKHDHSIIMLN